jgi:hypothetical protein
MMTPRGVADVQVYTPERVEARYGIRPDQIPGLHRAEGRHERQHPGIRGSATRPPAAHRAVRLARGGRRARRRALAARSKAIAENAEQAACVRSSRAPCGAISSSGVDSATFVPAAARPLRAEGDLQALRVSRAARAGRHARRGAARRGATAAGDRAVPWREAT